ncbi:MAG: PDZ domain-containing protein [Magnetococcales bacterium]|nr:PDZ domain-containing protein [Magnetococcales bacterium]
MNRVPQWLMAGTLVLLLGIMLVALFGGPGAGRGDAKATGGVTTTGGVGQLVAQPGGMGNAPVMQPVAAVAPVLPYTRQGRVAGGPIRTDLAAVPQAYVAPTVQLSEAHWQGMEAIVLTAELKKKLQLPLELQGVMLDETTLAAAAAGLRAGDVLVAINGRLVTTLEGMLQETKRVKRQPSATLTVQRRGRLQSIVLTVPDELGFAQVETAPMVLSGDIPPHSYRGPCTQCHAIGTGGHLVPDPDLVTLPAPTIRANMPRPHQDRGPCVACHTIIP